MRKVKLTLSDRVSSNDPSAHNRIVSSLKRAFSRSPTVRAFLAKHRREEAWLKKDGSKAKNPKVFYVCAHCKQEFRSNAVQVDHIDPVVPLNIPSRHLSYNDLIARLFCDESNLQILCKEHHRDKSAKENAIRDEWQAKLKFIVYETVNTINGKKYIGVHRCEDYDDVYFGSGKLLKAAIEKYGVENFHRYILYVYDNAAEAFAKEKELVSDEVVKSEKYYNIAHGGSGNVKGVDSSSNNKIKIICHQTQKVYDSLNEAAADINISASSISRALDNPNQPVANLHFFSLLNYDDTVTVTFPTPGRAVVHLNVGRLYNSLEKASTSLGLNYRSLRNAMRAPDDAGVCQLDDQYFIYASEYDPSVNYFATVRRVRLIELNKQFKTCTEAAQYLKHPKPSLAGVAIGKAIREKTKMYKYTWEYIEEKIKLKHIQL